jgi:hypothetical protein
MEVGDIPINLQRVLDAGRRDEHGFLAGLPPEGEPFMHATPAN